MKPWNKGKTKKDCFKRSNNTPKKKAPERKPWVKRPDGSIIMHDYHNVEAW